MMKSFDRGIVYQQTITELQAIHASYLPKIRKIFGLSDDWYLNMRITPRHAPSRGGFHVDRKVSGPFICLSVGYVMPPFIERNKRTFTFDEYASYEHNPFIGSLRNITWKKWIEVLFLHECAHAIQFSISRQFGLTTSPRFDRKNYTYSETRGHKRLFKDIYRILRATDFSIDEIQIATPCDKSEIKIRRITRQKPAPTKRKIKPVIGMVYIQYGRYRNRGFRGLFPLVKGYTEYKSVRHNIFHGFVTIMIRGLGQCRVSVKNDLDIQIIPDK